MTDPEAASPSHPSVPRTENASVSTERMIGEFRLLRRLGHGGMAEVYLAEQTSLNRQVAIKILKPELLADEVHVKRFEREAKAAAGLRHNNIVQVYMVGAHAGVHYIAQEFVQGWNLKEYLGKKGSPDLPVVLHIMKQIAAALASASAAGIVHRDIKPENILITRKGEVKVADFGLAQLAEPGEAVALTQVGITMGTPLYMSPEQISGEKVDQRSDIYSFGVTCYRMLAGQPPFRGETALAIAMQHLNHVPESLIDRRPDLPPLLCQIVHKMMARHPADRYPDANAILNDLRRVSKLLREQSGGEGENLPTDTSPSLPSQRISAGHRWQKNFFAGLLGFLDGNLKKQLALFAAVAILVGGASAALGWWLRPGNPLHAPVSNTLKIPQSKTAAEQYFLAMRRENSENNEDAWQAVIDNFSDNTPETAHYKHLAQEQLASINLGKGRLGEAAVLYNELVSFGNEDERLKAVGLAGQAIIASMKGDFNESQRIIAYQLFELSHHLSDEMRELVLQTIVRNRQQLGEKDTKKLEDQFRPDPLDFGGSQPPR